MDIEFKSTFALISHIYFQAEITESPLNLNNLNLTVTGIDIVLRLLYQLEISLPISNHTLYMKTDKLIGLIQIKHSQEKMKPQNKSFNWLDNPSLYNQGGLQVLFKNN